MKDLQESIKLANNSKTKKAVVSRPQTSLAVKSAKGTQASDDYERLKGLVVAEARAISLEIERRLRIIGTTVIEE